ncbi:helix-turn-helix transcriptional regulator [Pantoea sp. 18069]|uniref:helix-turn-helix transcriptional regulator n=1 Tax=Pantoea sp. 18069 TaxID=2681415 RepID=UPI0013575892|nr:helix-turn-helix transcriptional regulator [Pantoea sp. 18069]
MGARPPLAWQLPSGAPVLRTGLCGLAQPCLTLAQQTPRFLFHDATLLWIAAGRLDLVAGSERITVDSPQSLLLVTPQTCADLRKTPGGAEQRFRSVFLTFPVSLLDAFHRARACVPPQPMRPAALRTLALDEELASTLRHTCESVALRRVSDERLAYRLMDLLAALAERGHAFPRSVTAPGAAERLRTLIGEAPDQHWTAPEAGRALAMSEATLRRRLKEEGAGFEALLIDVRMHHAMMLVQTTSWSIARIALACGYKSQARFAQRFRSRFGYPPSAVR